MKTTIKIHGRDIEFSDQPPTRAGAYWHLWHSKATPELVQTECKVGQEWVGLWSATLVPVTEVKEAFMNGHFSGSCGMNSTLYDRKNCSEKDYRNSRARRVVEGLE